MTDEQKRRAILRVGSGHDIETVAAELDVDVATVEDWLSEPPGGGAAHQETTPSARDAREALSGRPWALIEASDPEFPENEVCIAFDDLIAHQFSGVIDAIVDRLRDYPGLRAAHREDRELIIGTDTGVDRAKCVDDINDWVEHALKKLSSASDS